MLVACATAPPVPRAGNGGDVGITIIYAPTVAPTETPESRTAVLAPPALDVPAMTNIPNANLVWRECSINGDFNGQQASDCFGDLKPAPSPTAAPDQQAGELRLKIGSDTYRTIQFKSEYFADKQCFNFYKNANLVGTQCGANGTFSPNIGLRTIGDKAAWEFVDGAKGTIIFDGKEVGRALGLDSAHRPFELDGKLIFVGKKNDKYVVVYNQQVIGPEFDLIHLAYCCEPAAWSVRYGSGKYWFWGKRNGQSFVVEVSREP